MVLTCSGLNDSSGRIRYTPDQGCFAEKGKDYEKTVTAFIALEASNIFDDFCLITNPINCAPFDDVILCTKKNDTNVIYLFQIKSKTNPISIFDDEFKNKIFNKNKSKFFIGMLHEKYEKGIIEIKRIIPQKYIAGCTFEIIFFTNRPIQENSDIFELTHTNLFNAKHGEIYKFKDEFILAQDKHKFLQSISVYTKQTNVDDTSVSWIKQYLNSEEDAAKKIKLQFFLCIRNYCEIQTEKDSLSKEFVCKLFAYATFVNFAVCIDDYNENDYKKYQQFLPMDSLWESIKNNNISMSYNHVQYILGKAISQFQDFNISPDEFNYYKQIIFDELNMTEKQLEFYIGCLLGELPFIVRSQNLTLPKKYCKVIVIESNNAESQGNLSKIDALPLQILKAQTITTSCGQKFKIGTLIEEIEENISISDVISMIISCANNSNNELGFFIKRKLNKVTLNSNIVLHKNSLNSTPDIFIINTNGFSKEDFIKQFNVDEELVLEVKLVEEIAAYLQNFEKDPLFKTKKFYKFILINKHRTYISHLLANVHFLHYFKEAPLVWTKSNGSTKNIMNYLVDTICNDIRNEKFGKNKCKCCVYLKDINSYFQNNFLIISGVPGIGKTTYLKQFASFVPTKDFILFVTLMEFYDYFEIIEAKSSNAEKHISHFYKEKDKVLRQVFEAKLKTKQIIILFDGFDEIAPRYTDIVSKIIKEIRKAEYKIILTTRSVLKNKVENIFSTFATSLSPFSPIDQMYFLKIYFDKISSNVSMNVSEFIDIITKSVNSEFIRVPLNIFLIAEVLYTEIKNKKFKLTNFKINLLQLYEKFINYKLKIYSEKITNKNINLLSINRYHQYFAINKLFKELGNFHIIKASLKDAISNYSIELKTGGEKVGILISDINEIFIHRTVAEYFAAKWLSEVFDPPEDYQHIKHEKRFAIYVMKLIYSLKVDSKFKILKGIDMDFAVIKSFFESIINNKNKLHQAAAESNYEYIKTIFHFISYVNEIKCLNVLKRPLLNTVISKNDLLYKKETLQVNISLVKVLNLLIKPKGILTQKDILQASIKDYVNIKQKQLKKSPLNIFVHKSVNNRYFVYFSRLFELWEIFHEQNLYNCNLQEVFQGLEKQYAVCTIFNAASNGHLNILQQFYKSGENMNIQNQHNKSLIHFAAENGHLDIVKFLNIINKENAINKLELKDDKERTVLHYAVISGNLDMVKYLNENQVNLMSYDNDGLTAFHYAIIHTKITIAEYFLTLNFNIYSPCKFGYSPIEYAVGFLNKKMFEFLLSKGANINYRDKYGYSIMHTLIYTNIYINRNRFYTSTDKERLEICKKYNKRCFDFITFLVKSSVSLNQKDHFGRTPLTIAVKENSLCVKILIENHADLNCMDNNGSTILHMAAYSCNLDILRLILPHFDINVEDNHKNSTLHYAVSNSDNIDCFEVVNFLIENGADPQSKNNDGTTPLHCAAFSGHLEVLKLLLTHGNIKVQDSKGYTPLHYALINEEVHTARCLINNGANVNLGNKNNELPLDIAVSSPLTEIKEIVSMLKAMNAKSEGKRLTFNEPFDRTSLYPHLKKITIFNFEYSTICNLIKKYINIIIQENDT